MNNPVEISDEYEKALDYIDIKHPFVLISGKAGTGKSTFIRLVQDSYENVVTVAPTGISALNVGGQTIHSFFLLPPQPLDDSCIKYLHKPDHYKRIRLLIIDEISMVRADVLDAIDKFLRNNCHSFEPFGGIPVIAVGDLFQLPPVVSRGDEAKFLRSRYTSPHFFNAKVFDECSLECVEFSKVYRQKDEKFVKLLNIIRNGEKSDKVMQYLNSVCLNRDIECSEYLTLTCTKAAAASINEDKLNELPGKIKSYQATIVGKFEANAENYPAPELLELKKGAQVMFTKNKPGGGWVNGTLGIVEGLENDLIRVNVSEDSKTKSVVHVEKEKWDRIKHVFDPKQGRINREVIGSYSQFPLRLAWAVTIHKAQGQTFDYVKVDIGNGAFASGQLYVALSRCRSIEGLSLATAIRESDVQLDPHVLEFHNILAKIQKENSSP
jgi:ATP-dependent DNA helicase PIF1